MGNRQVTAGAKPSDLPMELPKKLERRVGEDDWDR
jgi:hypothetical protein